MTLAEYRSLYQKSNYAPTTMSAEEWRDMMRKKARKPASDHANDIRTMLKLARIEFEEEYAFHPKRKWRFDFAIVEKKIAIEYEGIFATKSRHTTVAGYSKDVEKYNAAAKLGWRVLRYTAKNYKFVVDDVNSML